MHFILLFHFSKLKKYFSFLNLWNIFLNSQQNVGAGIDALTSISDGLDRPFSVERWKGASYEGRDGWRSFYLPPESAFLTLML